MTGGVTMELNSPNWQEIHWIREMLQQGMVVARQATATGFSLVKKPIPYTGARG